MDEPANHQPSNEWADVSEPNTTEATSAGAHPDEVTERRVVQDEILIAALATGRTDEEAAAIAGCSARTVRRRRQESPAFVTAVTEARSARVAQLAGRLIELGDRAREVIAQCLDDEEPHVRLRAADMAQRSGERLHRASGVDAELAELRAVVAEIVAAHREAQGEEEGT